MDESIACCHGALQCKGSDRNRVVKSWAPRRPARKARGARIPGVCKRRATQPGGMHRRPNWQPYSGLSPSDPCSAIARVLECHHSCAATSAVTHHAKASLVPIPRGLRPWLLAALALGVIVIAWVVVSLRIDRPVAYADIGEHFKYGSIGSEPGVSLLQPVGGVLPPYWVFRALPAICRDKLRGGYASFGFIDRAGPRSADRRLAAPARSGSTRSGSTAPSATPAPCAIRPRRTPRIVLGMPAHQLDLQAFVRVRARLHARQPAHRRQPSAGGFPRRRAARRCSSGCCCAPASSIG